MTEFLIAFGVGVLFGTTMGVIVAALMGAASDENNNKEVCWCSMLDR